MSNDDIYSNVSGSMLKQLFTVMMLAVLLVSVRPFAPHWVNCDAMLSKELNDEWSVATDGDSSNGAGSKKNLRNDLTKSPADIGINDDPQLSLRHA